MRGILGKKIGMTSVFDNEGKLIPCTVVEAGPCTILQKRTEERDGYEAVQLGFGERSEKNVTKPEMGHFNAHNAVPVYHVREFKGFDNEELSSGEKLRVDMVFEEGEKVTVSGTSKGKGFQGVMRRHNFGGVGGATHGQKDRLRAPGSIGQSSYPSRVFKGMRMAGRMGSDRITTKNLQVVKIMPESNIILIKGAVPGTKNSLLEIHKQV